MGFANQGPRLLSQPRSAASDLSAFAALREMAKRVFTPRHKGAKNGSARRDQKFRENTGHVGFSAGQIMVLRTVQIFPIARLSFGQPVDRVFQSFRARFFSLRFAQPIEVFLLIGVTESCKSSRGFLVLA